MSYDDVLKIFSLNALRVLGWRPPGTGLPVTVGETPKPPPQARLRLGVDGGADSGLGSRRPSPADGRIPLS